MIKLGTRIIELRKQKGWSQTELAKQIKASREAIGKYERNEAQPSVETAKKIADAFDVSLDYLVGEGEHASFDKKMLARIQEIQNMESSVKDHLFCVVDAVIRDYKTQKAYAS